MIAQATVSNDGGVLLFRVPMRLTSQNVGRGWHWQRAHKDTKAWELALMTARAIAGPSWRTWSVIKHTEVRRDPQAKQQFRIIEDRAKERRRVEVLRLVPDRRYLTKDRLNRAYLLKPLHDALVRLGLLTDDKDLWLDVPAEDPREEISPDGRDWTVIRITAADPARGQVVRTFSRNDALERTIASLEARHAIALEVIQDAEQMLTRFLKLANRIPEGRETHRQRVLRAQLTGCVTTLREFLGGGTDMGAVRES